jgi:hypothetical protein
MKNRLLLSRASIALVLVLCAVGPMNVINALSSGPPPGFTNAPGEANCTACHSSFALNSGTAGFAVTTPVNVAPASTNAIGLAFSGSSTPKHGFQITARDGAGNPSGSWQVVQIGLTKNATGSVFHHEHTAAGNVFTSWTANWIAPATLPNGPVTFYACGNEGNGSFTPDGDYIYARTAKMFQASLSTPSTGWPIGTSQSLALSAANHGGEIYFIVPAFDPTPVSFGGPFELQVTPDWNFLFFALATPQVFQNINSNLNATGQATATIAIPFEPVLIGLPLHFAGITADALLNPTEVSNRVTVTFQ